MPQVIIKRSGGGGSSRVATTNTESLGDEIIVTGDQVVVNSQSSVKVTFAELEIVVDLAE